MHAARTRLLAMLLALLGLLQAAAGVWAVEQSHGEKYALLVAVRRYNPAELRPLLYTEADITDLARVLRANGYRPENIVVLTQSEAALRGNRHQPLASNVRKELRRLLTNRGRTDTVLVAFSGHGVQLRSNDEFYFCPADAKLADPRTLVSLSEIYSELKQCSAGFKLLLADACRTDPLKGNGSRGVSAIETVTRPQARTLPGGVAAFFSCSRGQEAFEDDDLRQGVFFHFVIEGLRGAAVPYGRRDVTLPLLEDYVKQQVSDFVRRKLGKEQMPELRNDTRGSIALAQAPAVTPRPASVVPRSSGEIRTVALKRTAEPPPVAEPRQEVRSLLTQGQALAVQGRSEQAIACYNKALRLEPQLAEAFAHRGAAYSARSNHVQARADCNRAIQLNPRLAIAYVFRAGAYIGLQDQQSAFRDCTRALEIDPRLALAYSTRGFLYSLRGEQERALADLNRALQLDPHCGQAYASRASMYFEAGNYSRAVREYTVALRLEPGNGAAYFFRGLAEEQLGNEEQARSDQVMASRLGFAPPLP